MSEHVTVAELNERFGLAGHVGFAPTDGGLTAARVRNAQAAATVATSVLITSSARSMLMRLPRVSDCRRTFWMFGSNRRFVARFEWDTLCPY